jgi:F-type H+-transporting ATPase subunit epsilon
MAETFDLAILTPDRPVFEGRVEYVQVPGRSGYLGVLAHHAALIAEMADGTLTVRLPGGRETRWQVSGGFFEVADDKATVLADQASGGEGLAQAPQE